MTKEAFQYLLVIVLLTMITVSFGALSFDLINVYFPDIAGNACSYDGCTGNINGSLAVLIIAFPVFVKLWQIIQRDIAEDKEKVLKLAKADEKVAKWLNGGIKKEIFIPNKLVNFVV